MASFEFAKHFFASVTRMLLTYLCVVSNMGCDTDATRNWSWEWNRSAADAMACSLVDPGGGLEGIGCRSHKRIATLALAVPMSPTSLRNVQK